MNEILINFHISSSLILILSHYLNCLLSILFNLFYVKSKLLFFTVYETSPSFSSIYGQLNSSVLFIVLLGTQLFASWSPLMIKQ